LEDNVVGAQLAVDRPAAGTVTARRQRGSRSYWLCFASVRSTKGTGLGASISGAQSRKRAWRWGDFRRIRVLHAAGESHVADFCASQKSFLALHKSSELQGATQNRRRRSGTPLVARKRPISEGALITRSVGLGRSGQLAQATPVTLRHRQRYGSQARVWSRRRERAWWRDRTPRGVLVPWAPLSSGGVCRGASCHTHDKDGAWTNTGAS